MDLYPIPPRVGDSEPWPKAVDLLELARDRYLSHNAQDDRDEYICLALQEAARHLRLGLPIDLMGAIEKRLSPCTEYREWLRYKGLVSGRHSDYERVQASRVAWINDLIAEFSGE